MLKIFQKIKVLNISQWVLNQQVYTQFKTKKSIVNLLNDIKSK